jgi:GxxExxY protein
MEPQKPQRTQMSEDGLNELSRTVIGCAWAVARALGSGFAEKVYENALAHELRKRGLAVVQQRGVTVLYDDVAVGEYATDLLVEDAVVVELKRSRRSTTCISRNARIISRRPA